jgi:Flp pilus assembly protein TadD
VRPAPREKLSSPPPPEPGRDEPRPAAGYHPSGEDPDAPSTMQVEHLLMEGDVRMTVSDYANAVKTFQRLVELVPDRAHFRVKLAIAMTFNPPTQKTAEREFLEAIRLDPQNADVHFQFGLYYKAMRVKSRAIAELQTAVRLNPRHKMARQELEVLSPKDSVLTSLKKLLK